MSAVRVLAKSRLLKTAPEVTDECRPGWVGTIYPDVCRDMGSIRTFRPGSSARSELRGFKRSPHTFPKLASKLMSPTPGWSAIQKLRTFRPETAIFVVGIKRILGFCGLRYEADNTAERRGRITRDAPRWASRND